MQSNDRYILDAIAADRIQTDPDTGDVWVDGWLAESRGQGYIKCSVGRSVGAHRVMWIHNVGPIPDGHVINHRNGVRDDNRLDNLEVVTPEQNLLHGHKSPNYRGTYRVEDLARLVDPEWLAMQLNRAAAGLGPLRTSEPHPGPPSGWKRRDYAALPHPEDVAS